MKNYFKIILILFIELTTTISIFLLFSYLFRRQSPFLMAYLIPSLSKITLFLLVILPFTYYYRIYIRIAKVNFKKLFIYLVIFLGLKVIYQLIFFSNIRTTFFEDLSENYFLLYFLTKITIIPILEELFFRNFALEYLIDKGKNKVISISIISIIFGLAHTSLGMMGFFQWGTLIYFTVFSVLLCLVYLRERNVVYPIILHSLYNALVSFI